MNRVTEFEKITEKQLENTHNNSIGKKKDKKQTKRERAFVEICQANERAKAQLNQRISNLKKANEASDADFSAQIEDLKARLKEKDKVIKDLEQKIKLQQSQIRVKQNIINDLELKIEQNKQIPKKGGL
ncbi:hypothetical protein E6P72_11280 [Moraxella osloensis]|nr:hypothetical protein [Moraxella osloensis]MDI4481650.1 hypothetical protein [Moraxella osloensis]